METIYLKCRTCGNITAIIDDELLATNKYLNCAYDGRHKELYVIGKSDTGIEKIINKKRIHIESRPEINIIMRNNKECML